MKHVLQREKIRDATKTPSKQNDSSREVTKRGYWRDPAFPGPIHQENRSLSDIRSHIDDVGYWRSWYACAACASDSVWRRATYVSRFDAL
jgi:hypothetical protein